MKKKPTDTCVRSLFDILVPVKYTSYTYRRYNYYHFISFPAPIANMIYNIIVNAHLSQTPPMYVQNTFTIV